MIDSKEGINPLDGWKPSVPTGEAFELGTKAYIKTEKTGIKELGKVGFVLVAGGLGERLGYGSAKVCVDSNGVAKRFCNVGLYAHQR